MEEKRTKKVVEYKTFTVLKPFTRERVYNPGETVSLNNKKQIEYLQKNKIVK